MTAAGSRRSVFVVPGYEHHRFKRIAVGVDGGEEGRDAIALGAALAAATGAGLSLIGVHPSTWFPVPGATDRATLRAQALDTLHRERDLMAPRALVEAVADTSVPRALLHCAQRWHADILVLGSASCAPDGRVAISTHGRQLLHDLPFALAVAPRGLQLAPIRLDRIGAGYDGGPEARAALEFAGKIGRATGATLVVTSVIDNRIPALGLVEWIAPDAWQQIWDERRGAARAAAEHAVSPLRLEAEITATVGDPGAELRELTERVDLMVVGSRRWGRLARMVVGGVGETLVADAGCPILIVPRPPSNAPGHAPDSMRLPAPV
jgi:nucleotide-binding universal stress UspA family protein